MNLSSTSPPFPPLFKPCPSLLYVQSGEDPPALLLRIPPPKPPSHFPLQPHLQKHALLRACNSQLSILGHSLSPPTTYSNNTQIRIAMDPIKMEKAKAMERYRKIQFLQILFQYLLTALVLAMAISKAFPPSFFSSMKLFFSVSLPNLGAYITSPKCVFIVCNAIVIFLFSESKLAGTAASSQEIYDEYLRHRQKLRSQSSVSVETKEKEKRLDEECLVEGDDKMVREGDHEVIKGVVEEEKREEEEEVEAASAEQEEEKEDDQIEKGDEQLEEAEKTAGEEDEEEEEQEEKEEAGMEAEELNRRAEDFIARINKQFKLEAQMLACGS